MRKDKQIDFQKAFTYVGPLNAAQTVYLAIQNKPDDQRKFIIKKIMLGLNFNQMKPVIEANLRKLYQSIQSNIIKPDFYALQDGCLYIAQKPYNMSLQNLIIAHKKEKGMISPDLIWTFTCKTYDTINRMKQTQFYHQNLKPSNIFLEYGQNQTKWLISETGFFTNFKNKFYTKNFMNIGQNNSSMKVDPLQNEFYSLGVMVLQMITLAPIQKIDQVIRQRSFQKLRGIQEASRTYGSTIVELAKQLLNPKQNLKDYFTKYREQPPRRSSESVYLDDYYRQIGYLQQFLKQGIITKIQKDLKDLINRKQLKCENLLEMTQVYDPDFNFTFQGLNQCQKLLGDFGIKIPTHQMVNVCHYFMMNSQFRYMDLLQRVLTPKDVIQTVIRKAISLSSEDNHKDFFEAQTGGRDAWKAEDIRNFFIKLGVNIQLIAIKNVLKQWTNDKNCEMIKYKDFHIAFKGVTDSIMSVSKSQMHRTDPSKQVELKQMLEQIRQKVPDRNLVTFFRLYDNRQKWIVTSQIQRQLKKYVNIGDAAFKNLCEEMWRVAGVPGQTASSKILRYVLLLKVTKVYEITQLFRLVLAQKINQSNREKLFRQYARQQKGWTVQSFIDFNHTEMLDFDQRELRMIFHEMDRDSSKSISQAELIYKLTGLKQFDQEILVADVLQVKRNRRLDLFRKFVEIDYDKDLYLNSPSELKSFFEEIGLEVPINHCQILFKKFSKSQKFEYLSFLRFFEEPQDIFINACLFIINRYYNDDFDKFFQSGLKNHRKKWNRQSITYINDQQVLGFTQNQLGKIWQKIDKDGDGSLTKKQIGKFYGFSAQNDDQLSLNPLSSNLLQTRNKMQLGIQSKSLLRRDDELPISSNKKLKNRTMEDQIEQQIQRSPFLLQLKSKNCLSSAKVYYRQSGGLGWIQHQKFISIAMNMGIKANKISIINAIKKYICSQQNQRVEKVNYIKLLMFICEVRQNPLMAKAQILGQLFKMSLNDREMRTEDVFQKCRKQGQMKIRDLQRIMQENLQIDLYSDDIECLWKSWGNQDYLTAQDFDLAIYGQVKGKYNSNPQMNREYSFQDKVNSNRYSKDSQEKRQIPKTQQKNYAKVEQQKKFTFNQPNSARKQENQPRVQSKFSARQNQQTNQRNNFLDNLLNKKKFSEHQQPKESKNIISKKNNQKNNEQSNNYLTPNLPPRPSINKSLQKQAEKTMKIFEAALKQKGDGYLNDLFSKQSSIENKRFIKFLVEKYEVDYDEAHGITDLLSSYGRVKVQNVKKYIKKRQISQQLPNKKEMSVESRDKKSYQYKRQDKKSPQKQSSLPNATGKKLIDPRKTKMNIPLIKQHIKILISNFCKRLDISEMQPYFFDGGDTLTRQQFKIKCQGINNSISDSVFDKIFDYMKPKGQRINSIGFKIAFNYDEGIQIQENYLPEQIQKQIRQLFDSNDKNKNGTIQLPQIEKLLQAMGMNQTQKQIQSYFIRIDQNFDNKVDFKEFKTFIEQNILPQISSFDQQIDQLRNLLQINDLFNTKTLSINTLVAVLQKYGVRLDQQQAVNLVRALGNQNQQIGINNFLKALQYPSQPIFSTRVKSVLYKIKWKKKITMRQIRKVFENISSSFLVSYTSDLLKKHLLKYSTCHLPVLHESGFYYLDFPYRDIRNISKIDANLVVQKHPSDLIVEIKLQEAYGLPIPQNNLKNQIARRFVNITFYDSSAQTAKYGICSLQVDWDQDIEDQWLFDKTNRNIFVKINDFDMKKYERLLILFEFVITVIQDGTKFQVSCGSANIPVRQLSAIDGKASKKAKIISGLPNKAREIDKMSISKRSGWRGLLQNKEQQSYLELQIISSTKFADKVPFLASMPRFTIVNRKIVHFVWAFRQYFALKSYNGGIRTNPEFVNNFKVKVFLLCFDIPTIYEQLVKFWKQKIQNYVKSDAKRSRDVICLLLEQLYQVINCRQFQYHPSKNDHSVIYNKNLHNVRLRMVQQVFENIHQWLRYSPDQPYKRNKPYSSDFRPFKMEEAELRPEDLNIYRTLIKFYKK